MILNKIKIESFEDFLKENILTDITRVSQGRLTLGLRERYFEDLKNKVNIGGKRAELILGIEKLNLNGVYSFTTTKKNTYHLANLGIVKNKIIAVDEQGDIVVFDSNFLYELTSIEDNSSAGNMDFAYKEFQSLVIDWSKGYEKVNIERAYKHFVQIFNDFISYDK